MANEKARIMAKVEGIERAEVPLKAVVYVEEKEEIEILVETAVEKDEFELDLGIAAEDLPETATLTVVPKEVELKSHIRRLAEAGHAPTATIRRDLMLEREGRLTPDDLRLKPVDDVLSIWPLKRRVCGRVIKRDPVTGEECYVPGATVRVLDVDLHLFWWYPYPGFPWFWLFPYWPRREEIATTTTDECGRFCVDIPYFDIDAILRWRLRFRCLWENLQWPRVVDAIDLGVKPDLRVYPELELLPELEPKPKPEPGLEPLAPVLPIPSPEPGLLQKPLMAERVSEFYTEPKFEPLRQALLAKRAMFEPIELDKLPVLERPAFPKPIAPPALRDDEALLKILPDKEMLPAVRSARPIMRLLRCWPEFVPEMHLILDIPDIVFKVEQDTDGDGILETIYDEGYFDVNWNLTEPTTNVIIEASENAICVPCGPEYEPCTTTGIVGISEMRVDPAYLSTQGYAVRVNRPNPSGTIPVPDPTTPRPDDAETPFCGTVRLVGCPGYDEDAAYYKVFYSHEDRPETYFDESWYVHQISTGTVHHVVPDAEGRYPVLTPPDDYFPYHTLINWPTHKYANGRYAVRLELYGAAYGPIGSTLPSINVFLDNSRPSRVDFLGLRWRVALPGLAPEEGWIDLPLDCPIVRRGEAPADIELEVKYYVVATHLRDLEIRFYGCQQVSPLLDSDEYWHLDVGDNNIPGTWIVTVSASDDPGAYRFWLQARSRAFKGTEGLAADWYFDTLHIWRTKALPIAILDMDI